MGTAASVVTGLKISKDELKNTLDKFLYSLCEFDDDDNDVESFAIDDVIRLLKVKTDVFLSHDWGIDGKNHLKIAEVNKVLKGRGLSTWFDSEKMEGNIKSKMSSGIDNCRVVLVFITENYAKKVNSDNAEDSCWLEFGYACRRKTANFMLPIVLEESMRDPRKWTGQLGLVLGGSLYVDLCDFGRMDSAVDQILARIEHMSGPPLKELVEQAFMRLKELPLAIPTPAEADPTPVEDNPPPLPAPRRQLPSSEVRAFLARANHRADHERPLLASWSLLSAFDWARSPPNYLCDAEKSVRVGLGEYDPATDGGKEQVPTLT